MIEDDAIVLFLSHRWLRPGNPDDEVSASPRVFCIKRENIFGSALSRIV
jgi:hypothetical protein